MLNQISLARQEPREIKAEFENSQYILHAPSVVEDLATNIVYLGCDAKEVQGYLNTLSILYRCSECWVNKRPEHLNNFEKEIVIPDIQAVSDTYAWGLDYLIQNQLVKHWGINDDEYIFYSTGVIPA